MLLLYGVPGAADYSFLRAASNHAARLLPASQPQHIANLSWAFARLSYRPTSGSFILKAASDVAQRLGEYGCENLSTLLWAWARWQYRPSDSLLQQMVALLQEEAAAVSTHGLLNAVWSLGIMQHVAGRPTQLAALPGVQAFAGAAAAELTARRSGLSARELSAAVVALATLHVDVQALPAGAARQLQLACMPVVKELPSIELAKLVWALARLGWREPQLLTALGTACCQRMQAFPAEVGLFVLCYAVYVPGLGLLQLMDCSVLHLWLAQCPGPLCHLGPATHWQLGMLVQPAAGRSTPNPRPTPPHPLYTPTSPPLQSLARLAWAMAVLDWRPTQLHDKLTEACLTRAKSQPFEPLDRARLLFGYASGPAAAAALGPKERQLVGWLLEQTQPEQLARMGPSGVAALLWACSRLQLKPRLELVHAAALHVARNAAHFDQSQLVQVGGPGCRQGGSV